MLPEPLSLAQASLASLGVPVAGVPPLLLHIPDSPYDDYDLTSMHEEREMWIVPSPGARHSQPRNSMAFTTRSMATMYAASRM